MKQHRRDFIKLSGGLAAGLAIGTVSGASLLSSCSHKLHGSSATPFGIQLYTLRDDMPKDPKGVLKQLAAMGYKQIESYESNTGMYWGMTNTEFKKYLDDLGMTIVSSHTDINTNFEKKAAEAAAIGMKYLICPWLGPQKSLDDYSRFAEQFNLRGEICRKNGIRFAYHNHDYSFVPINGQMPQDLMMKNTDPALVDYEMDIYWVVTAKQDPIEWLKKYPNRFKLSHIKDRMKNATESGASTDLGKGSIDFAAILKEARKQGMEYFIVEQERYDGTTPLKAVETNAEYMKSLKF